jgi:hypothetical protein
MAERAEIIKQTQDRRASANASVLYRACGVMMARCKEVQARLVTAFPEVADPYVEHHQS